MTDKEISDTVDRALRQLEETLPDALPDGELERIVCTVVNAYSDNFNEVLDTLRAVARILAQHFATAGHPCPCPDCVAARRKVN